MANNVDLSLTSSVSITHDKMRGMMVCFEATSLSHSGKVMDEIGVSKEFQDSLSSAAFFMICRKLLYLFRIISNLLFIF